MSRPERRENIMSSTRGRTAGTQGTYSKGMGSAEARVTAIGSRGGFTYVTFLDGSKKGTTSKVPSSWVTSDRGAYKR